MCPPLKNRLRTVFRSGHPRKLTKAAATATAAALFLSHHAADAFFGPARPSLAGVSAAGAPSRASATAAAAAAAAASTDEGVQRRHFYGYGDPDHVPSILQNITAQRYTGEGGGV